MWGHVGPGCIKHNSWIEWTYILSPNPPFKWPDIIMICNILFFFFFFRVWFVIYKYVWTISRYNLKSMGKRTGYCASWCIEYGLTSGAIALSTLNTIAPSAIVLDGWDWKLNFQLSISTIELKKVKKNVLKN